MRAVYVNLKSELTIAQKVLEALNYSVFRSRTECSCIAGNNRRNAIIAISDTDPSNHLKIIRCKGCVKEVKNA